MVLRKTIKPFGQIWYGVTDSSVEDGLEASDKASADVYVGQADLVVHDPLHIIRFFLVLQVLV